MRERGAVRGWKALSRVALIGLIGGGAAACSSDASRLGEPFSNPFSSLSGEPAATGSLGEDPEAVPNSAPAIRTPRIRSEALAAPAATMSPRSVPSAPPVSGAVSGLNPSGMNPSGMNPDAGRALKAAAPAAPTAMTPRAAPAAPQTKLTFTQGPKPAEKKAEAPAKKAESKAETPLKKAETKADAKAPAKAAETKAPVKVAEIKPAAKAPEPKQQAKAEPKLDPKKAEAAKKAEAEAKAKSEAAKSEAAKKVAEAKAAEAAAKAAAKETKQAAKETPAPAPVKVASAEPTAPVAQDSSDSFRWPAKGRVINGYGSSGNEGINIAVPEGTPVKAAEEGTVAYAGSDVKGYGKLVLVRHNNGYVSAYAHNGEIDVRPGEKVKRGQVIAKSGATGNVTSPQLHFEIRKGATPVDPIPHLASN